VKAEFVLLACGIGLLIAIAVSTIASVALCFRLKRFEHEVWLSIGSPMPKFGWMEDLGWFTATRRFLREKGHRSLRDQKSSSLGDLVVLTDRVLLGVALLVLTIAGYIIVFVKP
jgi:hypothetical protein